jgi:BASS family bile acid:Na+ symporter
VAVDVKAMLLSIVQVVLIPIILGMLVNRFFGRSTSRVKDVLPVVSITAICLIIAAVVSHNSERIMTTGLVILIVVILHNLLGYLLGYLTGVVFRMSLPRKKALSIEIGMQNSGLATTLAASAFPDIAMATVPGAIPSPSFLFYISVFSFLPGEHHSVKYLFDLLTVNRIRILVF